MKANKLFKQTFGRQPKDDEEFLITLELNAVNKFMK